MNSVTISSRVDADGVLRVMVPLGPAKANHDVRVTIDTTEPAVLTQDQWRAWVMSMAGRITDPTFRRHEQGDYEQREELP